MVAAPAGRFSDPDLVDEMAAEAFATTVERWPVTAVPPDPAAG